MIRHRNVLSGMNMGQGEKWVVTAATRDYLPGAVALLNSVRSRMPTAKVALLFFGEKTDCPTGFDRVLINIEVPKVRQLGKVYGPMRRRVNAEMFARVLIPKHFGGTVLYLDADCLMLRDCSPLWELSLGGLPTAAVSRSEYGLDCLGWFYMATGVLLLDCDEWGRLELVAKHFALAGSSHAPNANVEGLMSQFHGEQGFKWLPPAWQNLAQLGDLSQQDYILHFGWWKPWLRQHKGWWCSYTSIWQAYADNDAEKASRIQEKLPVQPTARSGKSYQQRIRRGVML